MKKIEDKLFQKFEDAKIFKETLNQINGGTYEFSHPSEATGDHECTNGGLDCSDGNNTDVFKDSVWTKVENDNC